MEPNKLHQIVVFEEKEELFQNFELISRKLIPVFDELLISFDYSEIFDFLVAYDGIPTFEQRKKYWSRIVNSSEIQNTSQTYQELLQKDCDQNVLIKIEEDVNRTFKYFAFFRDGGIGQEMLFRILKAYAIYDPNTGFSQGMGYIAAIILIHFDDPEEAFWVFARLMNNPRFDFLSLFSEENPIKLKCLLNTISRLVEIVSPRLFEYFKTLGVGVEIFCWSSFCSLFSQFFQFETTTFIWDIFFLRGWKFLLRLQLGIIISLEDKLLRTELYDISNVINNFTKYMRPKDVWKISKDIILNETQLQKWEDEEKFNILEKKLLKKNKREENSFNNHQEEEENIFQQSNFGYDDDDDEEEEEEEINPKNFKNTFSDFFFGKKKKKKKKRRSWKKKKCDEKKEEEEEIEMVDYNDISRIVDYLGNITEDDDDDEEGNEKDFHFDFSF